MVKFLQDVGDAIWANGEVICFVTLGDWPPSGLGGRAVTPIQPNFLNKISLLDSTPLLPEYCVRNWRERPPIKTNPQITPKNDVLLVHRIEVWCACQWDATTHFPKAPHKHKKSARLIRHFARPRLQTKCETFMQLPSALEGHYKCITSANQIRLNKVIQAPSR